MPKYKFTRRDFFKAGTISSGALMMGTGFKPHEQSFDPDSSKRYTKPILNLPSKYALDLTPARWIWYPSQRTLANTVILFRKTIQVFKEIKSAKGWIIGDSRYQLEVNGKREQWGPPPADPRFSEADPIDITMLLNPGENVIGATVLYYGYGDGTWPVGKPGFLFKLEIEYGDRNIDTIVSDQSWDCHLARSWNPGQYKRWYLRALQEEFDANKYPFGWSNPGFDMDNSWIQASVLMGAATNPALSSSSSDYMYNSSSSATITELRKRTIPLIKECDHFAISFREAWQIAWKRSPKEYFEMIVPDAYEVKKRLLLEFKNKSVEFHADPGQGYLITFNVQEQMVGWPFFTIVANKGTTVELMIQEGHRLHKDGGPVMMNNHFHSWTRFICKEGENHFSTFDFESVKWIQFHIHDATGTVVLKNVGIKRRMYDWPNPPKVRTSDSNLQKLLNASINTIYNNSLDTIVDGMGRERQQYSGDIGHLLHAIHRVFGEEKLPARFLNTYSQGLTQDGFFLDTWPAYDRLNRLAQRQLDLTKWGPLLDHGVGFNFDCYYHYTYTGSLVDLEEVWPRLERFFRYLQSIVREDGMLPVENIGIPAVWIDHDAYRQQRHKQCAFNLYAIAMLRNAFSELAKAQNQNDLAGEANSFADQLLAGVIKSFWDAPKKLFICNKPWIREDGKEFLCDRSLSTAIIFDLIPGGEILPAVKVLAGKPDNLGLSYPPNTNWYLWALGKAKRFDAIFKDFNDRWIKLNSVHENNTMQESWNSAPDSSSQWSHASIAPLLIVYMDIAGIRPMKPGYEHVRIEPMPGHLQLLDLVNYTPYGAIFFAVSGKLGKRRLKIRIPTGIKGELVLDERESLKLDINFHSDGKKGFRLKSGEEIDLNLKYL